LQVLAPNDPEKNWCADLTEEQSIPVLEYLIYPTYDSTSQYSDNIAIITLQSPLTLGANLQVAQLPSDNSDQFVGDVFVAEGWGRTSGGNALPCPLQVGRMTALSTDDANALFSTSEFPTVSNSQLAVYDLANNVTMCNGDSGGGLYCPSGGNSVLCGINSFGVETGGVCLASYPSLTTRVSAYLDWIMVNAP
jgi:hypothetical protein